jgi:arsenite-transporting ATPase
MNQNNSKLLLFGGKGGVGKTTCSAAVAVRMASEGVRTLHITTDMAPSLSDIYGFDLRDRFCTITTNLDAIEISQDYIAGVWKEKFGPDFVGILSHFLDMEGMLEDGELDLLDYIGTAPSLREETLLDMIMEMAVEGRYGRIVWDTAPAGETLKLLNMPRLMRQHLRAGAKVYEAMDRIAGVVSHKRTLAGIMEEWVERSERIAQFLEDNTLFFIVANPEALVVNQAERVLALLKEAGFEVRGLIINRVAVEDGYGFLAGMHARQQPYIQQLVNLSGGLPIARIPLTVEEIHGVKPLKDLGENILQDLGILI